MKNTLKIDLTTYLVIILSFFCAQFKDIIIIYLIILIHELGHLFWLKIYHKKVISITIYPFGGITKYHSLINHSLKEEFLISLGGIINQIILYLPFILLSSYNLINTYTFTLFLKYNTSLLIFNLLPIIPLDGSKTISILLESIFSYHLSNQIKVLISIISLIIFLIYSFSIKINSLIIISFLIIQSILYIKQLKYLEEEFILERYLYHLPYRSIKYLKSFNKDQLYQNCYHYFNYVPESIILANMFDKS